MPSIGSKRPWGIPLRSPGRSLFTTLRDSSLRTQFGFRGNSLMKALLSGLSLLAFIPLIQAQTQTSYTLDQVFANMDMVAKTFRSSQADIVRTHVTVLVNDKDVSAGKFYYVRQGKEPRVKLELAKPNVQQLL